MLPGIRYFHFIQTIPSHIHIMMPAPPECLAVEVRAELDMLRVLKEIFVRSLQIPVQRHFSQVALNVILLYLKYN